MRACQYGDPVVDGLIQASSVIPADRWRASGIRHGHPRAGPVERERAAAFPRGGPGGVAQRARAPVAGRIAGGRPRPLVEGIGRDRHRECGRDRGQTPDRPAGRAPRPFGHDLPVVRRAASQRDRLIRGGRLVARDDRGRIGRARTATVYCVALADAAQLSVGVTATPVAALTGLGVAGAAGAGAVVKLQTGPLVDPPAPLATTCQ